MISGNFTSIPNNASITEYVFAFNNSLGNTPIFLFILGMSIVIMMGVYLWSRDMVSSGIMGFFFGSVASFFATLIKSDVFTNSLTGEALRLVSFSQFTFFLVILTLLVIYDRVAG